jgi:hypothetical protein
MTYYFHLQTILTRRRIYRNTTVLIAIGIFLFAVISILALASKYRNIKMEHQSAVNQTRAEKPFSYPSCGNYTRTDFLYCHHGKLLNLATVGYPEVLHTYDQMFQDLLVPPKEKRVFVGATNETRMEIVLIEVRRVGTVRLLSNIYNIANIYGGRGFSLTLYVSAPNIVLIDLLKDDGWKGINVLIGPTITDVNDYNYLLQTKAFWRLFAGKYILLTQTDAMLLREVTEEFFGYSYIGAPWGHDPPGFDPKKEKIGNGGYSLRDLKEMIEQSMDQPDRSNLLPEDVFFGHKSTVPPNWKLAEVFAVEETYSKLIPTAMHQMWHYKQYGNYFRAFANTNPMKGYPVQELTRSIVNIDKKY